MTIGPEPPSVPGYRVGSYLGRGAMGTLWEAHDRAGRRVALKVADRGARVGEERMRRHHRREAAAALHVVHPNLVRALAVGTTAAGQPYVALEYLVGESLGDRIRRLGPLPEEEAVRAGVGIAAALEHLHAHGLVHRDVKPDNVMVLEDGDPKLLDLGLVDESDLEAPGCGSPGFASPEMMKHQRVGPASDLWALGVTLATAVLGRMPFRGETVQDVLKSAYHDAVVFPPTIAGRPLSEGFRQVVGRLLEKAPGDRYRSAGEARLDLEATRDGDKPFGALWRTRGGGRRRWALAAAGLGAVAAVALAVAWGSSRPEPPPAPPAKAGPAVPDDPEVEAALASAARPGLAPTQARSALLRVVDRPMSAAQRARYEQALGGLAAPDDRRAEDLLRERARLALRRRAAGDLEGVRALLEEWPEDLRHTPAAAEGKRLAALWNAEARRPFQVLLDEVERAAAGADAPSAPVREGLRERLRAAQGDPAAPTDLRPALAAAEARLEALGARVSAEGREAATWASLARLWGEDATGREPRLRGFLAERGVAEARAGAALATLLANAEAAEGLLQGAVERAGARPVALWLDGRFQVGPLPAGTRPEAVLAPGRRIWDAAAPTSPALEDLVSDVGDEGVAAAWLLLHELPGRETLAPKSAALREILAHLPAPAPDTAPGTAGDPTWGRLVELWPLASRPWRASAPALPEPRSPLAAAWLQALSRERRPAPGAVAAVTKAREAFLADDWTATWTALEPTVESHPSDGEAALLRSLALVRLAAPLPTLGSRLYAFVEARRALDLDPTLMRATSQVCQTGVALHRAAPSDLRATLAPLVAAACESAATLRQDSAAALVFLTHHYADTDRGPLALRTARKAAAAWPDDPEALLALARVEVAHGDPARGRQALDAARARLGGEIPAWAKGWFR